MANDMNTVNLIGRVTRDTELKYTNSGLAVGSVSIAVNYQKSMATNGRTLPASLKSRLLASRLKLLPDI